MRIFARDLTVYREGNLTAHEIAEKLRIAKRTLEMSTDGKRKREGT